jgi:tetratricopeptide (TPR) repeat protein
MGVRVPACPCSDEHRGGAVRVRLAYIFGVLVLAAALAGCGSKAASGNLDQTLADGWRAYTTGDFDIARDTFSSVLRVPRLTDQQRFSALLGLATAYQMDTSPDLASARTYFEELGKLSSDEAQRLSMLELTRIDFAEGKTLEGRSRAETLRHKYPDALEADEATLMLAEIFVQAKPDKAASGGFVLAGPDGIQRGQEVLAAWLKDHPDNPLAADMHTMLADEFIELKQFAKAVPELQAALDKGVLADRTHSQILWQIARIAEMELKDYPLAAKYYQQFITDSRRDVLYYRAQLSLDRVKKLAGQATEQSQK